MAKRAISVWSHMAWAVRSKYGVKKYRDLVLQPASISTYDPDFFVAKIALCWTVGRGFAAQKQLGGENFGISVGEAFKLCLNPDGEYKSPSSAYQVKNGNIFEKLKFWPVQIFWSRIGQVGHF